MKLTPDQVRTYLKARRALIQQSQNIAAERRTILQEIKVQNLHNILSLSYKWLQLLAYK